MTILPCCYFPTTVLMVDDDRDFLSALTLLVNDQTPIKMELNPEKAPSIIKNHQLNLELLYKCFQPVESEELNSIDTSTPITLLDVSQLHRLKDDINRFAAITLLLVDYSMPQMNGMELCEQIREIRIKKAMITGDDDLTIAIDAFNAGIIDQFIRKHSDNFRYEVQSSIVNLQEKYFIDISKPLLDGLHTVENIWNNVAFYNFIKQMQKSINAVEFYLLDTHGSYIFIDANGKSTIVAIRSAQEIEKLYHIAVDNDASANILAKLADKSHFAFFLTEKNLKRSIAEWESLIHKATLIPDMVETFYAVLNSDDCKLQYDIQETHGTRFYLKTKTCI